MDKKRWLAWFLGLLIFVILLWKLDFARHWEILLDLHPSWFLIAVVLFVLSQFLIYLKWKIMYSATMDRGSQPLLPIFSSIVVCGMLSPARSGDIIVSLGWRRIQGKVLAWSIFNRITEGGTTLVLSLFILGVFFSSYLASTYWILMAVILFLISLIVFLSFHQKSGLIICSWVKGFLQRFNGIAIIDRLFKYEEAIERHVVLFYQTMEIFRARRVLVLLIGVTLVKRATVIVMAMAILMAIGVRLPLLTVLGILAAMWMSVILSPVPGGIGIGDIAPGLILSILGFQAQAGPYIVLNRFFELMMVLFWGMMWWGSIRVQSRTGEIRGNEVDPCQ
ncbi:MAG: flippase-like domain-containing protein [Candidatus Omnitrophica bacterium]|nr:flippase-like domain-containing protein [Candidatus Omnitrophota bacterium]